MSYPILTGGAVVDGFVAAKSYLEALQFHDFHFIPLSESLPEPGTLLLLFTGVALLGLSRLRSAHARDPIKRDPIKKAPW